MNWPDAINRLPEHEPRLDAWDRLDTDPRLLDLRADTTLDLFLKKLPQHDPKADLWSLIDAELTADETLDKALASLPQHEPRAAMWEQISSAKQMPSVFGRRMAWAAAASVLLCLLGGYWFYRQTNPAETVTVAYSVETVPTAMSEPTANLPADNTADEHLEAFINQACEQQVVACKKPDVQDLRQQLADLDQRKQQINKQLTVFSDDADLVRAQIRIENERADVTKELVRILRI